MKGLIKLGKKETPLSAKAIEILKDLKENGSSTLAEIKQRGLEGVNSSHLGALKNRGLVTAVQVEKDVVTVVKRKVLEYSVIADSETAETETD